MGGVRPKRARRKLITLGRGRQDELTRELPQRKHYSSTGFVRKYPAVFSADNLFIYLFACLFVRTERGGARPDRGRGDAEIVSESDRSRFGCARREIRRKSTRFERALSREDVKTSGVGEEMRGYDPH